MWGRMASSAPVGNRRCLSFAQQQTSHNPPQVRPRALTGLSQTPKKERLPLEAPVVTQLSCDVDS